MSEIPVRLSESRDELNPFGISKVASRTFFAELSGGGELRDASFGAGAGRRQEMPRHAPSGCGEDKRTTLGTLFVSSSVSVVTAGAAAGETAAITKRGSKETAAVAKR